ncbi:MAG: hypothetical protein KIT31_05255 [Deltaproteobacteria bacterium]|nr:hypothetical protein [Deltaproteobacteria bacterium]
MKKKHHRHRPRQHRAPRPRPRNATAGFGGASRPRVSSGRRVQGHAPDWKTIAAAVAGGAGSAAIGGLIVNQRILSSEAVGVGLMLGGSATAYFSAGLPRVVGTSVAAAGAGQFALAVMNKSAVKAHYTAQAKANAAAVAMAAPVTTATAQLSATPPIASEPLRESASGGGMVVDMFRDAAHDLDRLEDEWRYGIRDKAHAIDVPSQEPVVIDLDETA